MKRPTDDDMWDWVSAVAGCTVSCMLVYLAYNLAKAYFLP